MGYSLFKTVIQPEAIGNRLKEVQDSVQDLSKFGKMISLVSFLPFEYELDVRAVNLMLILTGMANKLLKNCTIFLKVSLPSIYDPSLN